MLDSYVEIFMRPLYFKLENQGFLSWKRRIPLTRRSSYRIILKRKQRGNCAFWFQTSRGRLNLFILCRENNICSDFIKKALRVNGRCASPLVRAKHAQYDKFRISKSWKQGRYIGILPMGSIRLRHHAGQIW